MKNAQFNIKPEAACSWLLEARWWRQFTRRGFCGYVGQHGERGDEWFVFLWSDASNILLTMQPEMLPHWKVRSTRRHEAWAFQLPHLATNVMPWMKDDEATLAVDEDFGRVQVNFSAEEKTPWVVVKGDAQTFFFVRPKGSPHASARIRPFS